MEVEHEAEDVVYAIQKNLYLMSVMEGQMCDQNLDEMIEEHEKHLRDLAQEEEEHDNHLRDLAEEEEYRNEEMVETWLSGAEFSNSNESEKEDSEKETQVCYVSMFVAL